MLGELLAAPVLDTAKEQPWWRDQAKSLIDLVHQRDSSLYVYARSSVQAAARRLLSLRSVDRVLYAVKANDHEDVLRTVHAEGLSFECVSPAEVRLVRRLFGAEPTVLFTPNFCPRSDFEEARSLGATMTIDALHPLRHWPGVFAGLEVFLRVDCGTGRGHHEHVKTSGKYAKFGLSLADLPVAAQLARDAGCIVVGLHCHAGSGIAEEEAWLETADTLASLFPLFEQLRYVDVGGGLPVDQPLNLTAVDAMLAAWKQQHPHIQVWMEPGRYLVARAGVLLARVTQVKMKAAVRWIGLETGFNSLIRPLLYSAYHAIHNLSRLDEEPVGEAQIVGPICETGDVFGSARPMPRCLEGDVVLIDVAGAYGHTMSSHYNMRQPALEVFLADM